MFKNIITIILFTILYSSNSWANQLNYNIFSDPDQEIEEDYDPFEKLNRKIHSFNKTIDKYSLKPVAKTYNKIIPQPIRTSINNILSNITLPLTTANSLLQLDFKNTLNSTAVFTINTTIGFLGVFNVAKKLGISSNREDFAQTLAKYKVPTGPFLMLPFLGASSMRALAGSGIDTIYNPIWINTSNQETLRYSFTGLKIINIRAKLYNTIEDIENNSLDPYIVIRNSYIQNRINLINND
jgi:phospholipid-binding lipoprotein MlaA